ESVVVTDRAACAGGGGPFTVVSCVELLFEESGSLSEALTLAVLEIVPPGCAGSTVTSTVTVHVPPFASEASEQLTVLAEEAEQSPPPSWIASTLRVVGTESETVTFVAASGPLLVTTRS